jgi:hypothetical protein
MEDAGLGHGSAHRVVIVLKTGFQREIDADWSDATSLVGVLGSCLPSIDPALHGGTEPIFGTDGDGQEAGESCQADNAHAVITWGP